MLTSIIRTVVPVIVGVVIAQAARAGLDLDGTAVESIVTTVVTAAYYVIARWLETSVAPAFGWLLGRPTAPSYVEDAPLS